MPATRRDAPHSNSQTRRPDAAAAAALTLLAVQGVTALAATRAQPSATVSVALQAACYNNYLRFLATCVKPSDEG